MQVLKRDGSLQTVQFDKITARISKLSYGLNALVDIIDVAQKVIEGLYNGVTTTQLDTLAAETAAALTTKHPDYALLANRIAVSNLHKNTLSSFAATMQCLYDYNDEKSGRCTPMIADDVMEIVHTYSERIDQAIDYARDFDSDYFGFKTLEKSYLLRINGKVVERPQHMYMRVAIGIHKQDIESAILTYHYMSEHWFTHATPTLFNAGTPKPQMSSCFLLMMKEDSIEGIYDTLKQTAKISQSAGGVGLAIHNIRATGSYISGTNGTSNGLIPMLRVFNDTARYVDQGGGKRKGAFAIYLEPWHADIFDFLDLRKNHGKEENRARDLFYALWIPDLFMQRVEADEHWSLFCPNEAPNLYQHHGPAFNELYLAYEAAGKAKRTIKAQELWFAIVEAQIETGTPYLLYKDAANAKSNHQHLGTIKSSNLCAEIIEYTEGNEVAVCNLASIALPRFVSINGFNFDQLFKVAYQIVVNLNRIIDHNYYPVPEAKASNQQHRPIGIGVQGLADTFMLLRMPFDSPHAQQLNKDIFETLYFAAMTASKDLAISEGCYASFPGSPTAQGVFQFDLWKVQPSNRHDWTSLKRDVMRHGLRNSLLIALMPTASTSQILGNNECFEPYTSNIYTRRVLSGEFVIVNKHLLNDLIALNLWSPAMKNAIIAQNGSIQNIEGIPNDIKALYKTVWEIKQRTLIDMAADRGAFVCQSQSLNLFIDQPTTAKLTSMHFYAWKKGLKTGIYYLRTQAAAQAISFTIEKQMVSPMTDDIASISDIGPTCTMEEGCLSCGS